MILSDLQILRAVNNGDIIIDPFDRSQLGPNSYDVRLGPHWKTFPTTFTGGAFDNLSNYIDPKEPPAMVEESYPEKRLLHSGKLYLAATVECVGSRKYVPFLDGKSSVGRLGIFIHVTAGRGDVGFVNHWTMEIMVVEPVMVYTGMPIGQFIFFETGDVMVSYDKRPSSKYNERSPRPRESMMWKNLTPGSRK